MYRVCCVCSYDGTLFYGYQKQDNLRTVQEEIENVLSKIHKKDTKIYSSGRTDALVHAEGMVFHFDTNLKINEENFIMAMNSQLPSDIYINELVYVDSDFHARFSSKAKEYHYLIDTNEYNPLHRNYRYYYNNPKFNISLMKEASKVFVGTHDFKSFTKNKDMENTIRTVFSLEISEKYGLITVRIIGDGFLHHMVRIIVAMLLEAGCGNYTPNDLKAIMEAKDRKFAPVIVPACGLYLKRVYY